MSRHTAILLLVATHILWSSPVGASEGVSPRILGSAASRNIEQRDGNGYTNPKANGGYTVTVSPSPIYSLAPAEKASFQLIQTRLSRGHFQLVWENHSM